MAGKRKIAVKLSPEGPKSKRQASVAKVEVEMEEVEEVGVEEVEEVEVEEVEEAAIEPKSNNRKLKVEADEDEEGDSRFLGEAVPAEEARRRWPHRYQKDETKEIIQAKRHFLQAEVDGQVFFLEDDAFVKGEEGDDDYICKIIEFFEAVDGSQNFTAQWFYRARDTVIQKWGHLIDDKRVFFSEIKDENPLDCLLTKLNIKILPSKIEFDVKENLRAACDYYCDRKYLIPYSSFVSLQSENTSSGESGSTISSDADVEVGLSSTEGEGNEKSLLDLYSGCGAMSTGLCLGAESGGVKLVTKWAVDINEYACKCLKLNHPETEVRNEAAEDFLSLLKEWEKLGSLLSGEDIKEEATDADSVVKDEEDDDPIDDDEIYEVEEILAICYGDLNKKGSSELHFKIRWKGYGPEEDTWEPKECLSSCQEKLKQFVSNGYKSKILPLPGTVDVICGGPPCQGISGHNRFRNKEAPLDDPKNKQLIVYMDIVEYLRPKFVLMENVVDILKFAGGYLGRYALGRLVSMGYQARIGMMAAGAYGLPQFRMRMFMWGALSTEKLPQYPLPTHKVIYRGVTPTEFESSNVCTDEACKTNVKKELYLEDAISDLPPVENDEDRDEMPYDLEPKTEFQRLIRLRRDEMSGCSKSEESKQMLYDHRPLRLNQDDYDRVIQIPKKKGANFRDLPGVRVRHDNKVEFDPDIKRVLLKSGKPLVPDYAMSFVKGLSSKPFGRLWWDETVSTVVTRAEPHNQVILHPNQDRVLTIRENARLQGFPDYYKLVGPIKERYIQVGNAVAVPVARALGYSLAKALRGLSEDDPVFTLPDDYLLTKYVSEPAIVEMQ